MKKNISSGVDYRQNNYACRRMPSELESGVGLLVPGRQKKRASRIAYRARYRDTMGEILIYWWDNRKTKLVGSRDGQVECERGMSGQGGTLPR